MNLMQLYEYSNKQLDHYQINKKHYRMNKIQYTKDI